MNTFPHLVSEIVYFTLAYFSRLLNAIVFRGTMHDTFSERCYAESMFSETWMRRRMFVDRLFFWDEEHCKGVWEGELARAEDMLRRHEVMKKLTGVQTYEAE